MERQQTNHQIHTQKQTKNTYATHDPAFPYLLSFFILLTSLAWSLAYANPSPANIFRIAFFFVFVHCLGASLLFATLMYFALPRLLGSRGVLVGRFASGRRRGLFAAEAGTGGAEEGLEFGYCFDVSFSRSWCWLSLLLLLHLSLI